MYEDTKSSIDWKGLFLKVIIGFLIVIIAVKGYTTLKGKTNNNTEKTTTESTADAKSSTTFTENMKKLKEAGQTYFDNSKDKLPSNNGNTTMVTLNELITNGNIESLTDEDGKICDGDSSYVTAILEGSEYKLKANLVCGTASSYSVAYLGQNNSANATSTTSSYNTKASNNSTTSSSNCSGNSCNTTCTTNNCGTSVSVKTNTSVSQSVKIGDTKTNSSNTTSSNNNTSNNTKYYTVIFDKNGGSKSYASKSVKEYNTVSYPGDNYKSSCSFNGWYLNGSKYDFNTPVTSDITLVAKYTCNYNYNDYNDYDNYDYDNDDYEETYITTVYSMGWDDYGTNSITINHTLRLPDYLDRNSVKKVRIKSVSYAGPINTLSLMNTYRNKHSDTFIYSNNGWEATEDNSSSNLSTVNGNYVSFKFSSGYKSLSSARNNGFDVRWTASRMKQQCTQTFSVNGEDNKCDYGIYYKVVWEYQR